ncbi:hypothetical protein V1264_004409 [Littorina saxatilis]|uniref:RZ-type domain-containing protein n=2 Tax=Littorina saxatilis TaxID=31220 RepID=A0AAN9B1G8_9CAEN
MPQDNVDEILRALEIDHSKTMDDYNAGHEIPKLWQCANGHRYVIGDCGNPNARGRCPECQIDIGGARYHVAAEGNLLARVADQTQPGHTLGAVESRSLEALPERGMSAAACAVLRFLTHATLYISAGQLGQLSEVCQLVRPAISDAEVIPFFWGHLQKDLQVLQRVLGRSCDDVYLLLHHLCHQLTKLSTVHYWTPKLKSKKEREEWERKFTEHYIQPLFQQTEEVIKNGNDLLVSDTRQGQNQLLNVVFEVSEQDEQSDEDLQHTAAPWKYRTRITVDHFFRKFELHVHGNQADSDRLPVLTLFHKESHHLRALHYVPDILALQRHLLQQLRHRLSRVDVSKTTVRDLLDKTAENPELLKLLEVFSQAWDIVKDYLFSHRCQTAEGKIVHLPEEYHTVRIGEKSPVGVLLPDTEGPGRCAYLLIHYLLVQHNDFLQRYCPHTRHTFDQLPEVPVHMLTRRHLVSYSPQTDLLPLVLAHCNSSLHLGHGDGDSATRLDYDFQGFELQLRNTLLLGKSRVLRGQRGDMEIETMSYCADITSSKLINRLGEKISQEALEVRVQRQITSEFQENLTDICQAIDSVNTTLTFLLTLKVTADQSLHAFMVETLRMKDNEGLRHSRKAQQYCCLKHVQSLWLLLCFLRARILATHNEEAFDEQGRELRKELSERQVDEVNSILRRLTPERVELVLTQIYQCIVLRLTGHSQDEDYASPDNYSLRWLLTDSVENSVYSIPGEDRQQDQLAPAELESFPESVLASQAIPVWTHVLTHLTERQQ